MFERLKQLFTPAVKERTAVESHKDAQQDLPVAVSSLFAGLPLNRFIDFESYLEAGSSKVWASWKACDLVAKTVMNTPSKVMRGKAEVQVAELNALLTMPNVFETWAEMLYKIVMHVKLTGNAYILKDSTNYEFKRPSAIYTLNPKRVRIALNGIKTIKGYLYNANGQSIPIEPEEMIHIRLPHPNREWYGIGEIEAGEPLFNDRINHDTWQERYWKNGAMPSGILVCEDNITDKQAWEKAKAEWQKKYGGVANSGKVAWLTGKWRYEQMGLNAQEMQNIEAKQDSIESIFLMHGIPLSVAGIKEAANFATADVDNQRFREYTVYPQVKLIEDRFNAQLIHDWGDNLNLIFNVQGLINVGKVVADLKDLFDRGGLTINEFREKCGLEADESNPLWQQSYVNQQIIPLELAGLSPEPTSQQAQRTVSRFVQKELLNGGVN